MYLFRLDAMEKAELILAQAVSRSHVLNLHHQHVDDELPLFESEMRRRCWWCLVVMDRRLTLETARPNLIQYCNVNLKNARNLSDEFLETHRQSPLTALSLGEEIRLEIGKQPVTAVGYLHAISSFARISGEILKVLQTPQFVSESTLEVLDSYLELIVEKTRKDLPSYLAHNPEQSFEKQYRGMDWWQVKLSSLLYIVSIWLIPFLLARSLLKMFVKRYLFLKILLWNHSFRASEVSGRMAAPSLSSSALCGQLACNVIAAYDQIPVSYPKFVFPFTHFITSASMILLALATKHPALRERYKSPITSALNTLYTFCHTTWVSGKSARTVAQLSKIAKGLYSRCNEDKLSTGEAQSTSPGGGLWSSAGHSYRGGSIERTNDTDAGRSVQDHRQSFNHEQRLHHPPEAEIPVPEASDHIVTFGQGMLSSFGPHQGKTGMTSTDRTSTNLGPSQEPLIPCLDAGSDFIARTSAGNGQNHQQLLNYDLTNSWLTNLSDGSFSQIPDWMMGNFDFEDSLSTSVPSKIGLGQASEPCLGMNTFPSNAPLA